MSVFLFNNAVFFCHVSHIRKKKKKKVMFSVATLYVCGMTTGILTSVNNSCRSQAATCLFDIMVMRLMELLVDKQRSAETHHYIRISSMLHYYPSNT